MRTFSGIVSWRSKCMPLNLISRGLNSKHSRGLNLNLYASNSRGRSPEQVTLETTPSKVAELQIGKYGFSHQIRRDVRTRVFVTRRRKIWPRLALGSNGND